MVGILKFLPASALLHAQSISIIGRFHLAQRVCLTTAGMPRRDRLSLQQSGSVLGADRTLPRSNELRIFSHSPLESKGGGLPYCYIITSVANGPLFCFHCSGVKRGNYALVPFACTIGFEAGAVRARAPAYRVVRTRACRSVGAACRHRKPRRCHPIERRRSRCADPS